MANTDIIARLRLQGEQFTTELSRRLRGAEDEAKSTSAAINRAFGAVKGVAITGVLGFGAAEVTAVAQQALDYASSLGEVSQQLGVTTKDLQVYRYAATQTGIEQDAMDRSLAKLTVTIGKAADGAKAPSAAFKALGVDVRDANGRVRTAGDIIPLLAESLSKIESPARRAALEVALFGKAGQQLDTLLAGGRGEIDGLAKAANDLGLVLSDEQIQNADRTADKLSELKQVLEARIASVVADNAEAIYNLSSGVADLAGNVVKFLNTNPQEALAIIGALGGAAIGGLPGAGAGLAAGYIAGDRMKASRADGSKSVADRQRALAGAQRQLSGFIRRENGGSIIGLREEAPLNGASSAANRAGAEREVVRQTALLRQAQTAARGSATANRANATSLDQVSVASGRAAASHGKTGRATDGLSKAAREAAAAQRELDSTLDEVVRSLDPARASAEAYATTLADIDRLVRTGKFSPEEGAKFRSAAERKEAYRQFDDDGRQRDDTLQKTSLGDFDPTELRATYVNVFEEAGSAGGEAFRRSGLDAASDIADLIGGKTGAKLSGALGKLDRLVSLAGGGGGVTSGGVGGTAGGILSLLGGKADGGIVGGIKASLNETFAPIKGSFEKIGGKLGLSSGLSSTLGSAAAGAGIGSATGSLVTVLGLKGSATGGALGGAVGGAIGGPLGAAIGGAVGSAVLGAFKSVKKGSATIGFVGDALGVTSLTGNSSAFKAQASGAAGSVIDSLKRIADTLGGDLSGSISTSIGVRHGDYRVDTSGGGATKIKNGAVDFNDDSEAAIRFAISDALKDGVIAGISDATKRILASGQDLEAALDKANFIESIPKQLKAINDPLGAAIDELDGQWRKQVAILKEAGASVEQMADAQKLYRLQMDQTISSVGGGADALKDFKTALGLGSASPLSLRDQEAAAQAALRPFLDKIDAGQSVDQDKYVAAAQSFLDVERQLYGSTAEYFARFDRIQAATAKAISTIDNAQPIRAAADPFAETTAKATKATAEEASEQTRLLNEIAQSLSQLTGGGGGGSLFAGNTFGRFAS